MNKLSPETIETVTNVVIKAMKKEKRLVEKEKKDRRLRNTRLLLKNYRMLEEHCKTVNVEIGLYEDVVYDPEELELHSLMKYKAKTAKMLMYFDLMFEAYEKYSNRAGEATQRRFKVIDRLYVSNNEMSPSEVAEYFNIHVRTVHKDADKALEELSIFIFGIEYVNDLVSRQKEGNNGALLR